MTDPHVRVTGQVEDMDGYPLAVGVDYDTVTIGHRAIVPGGPWRLTSHQAEEFAQLFVAACWEAAAQSTQYLPTQKGSLE